MLFDSRPAEAPFPPQAKRAQEGGQDAHVDDLFPQALFFGLAAVTARAAFVKTAPANAAPFDAIRGRQVLHTPINATAAVHAAAPVDRVAHPAWVVVTGGNVSFPIASLILPKHSAGICCVNCSGAGECVRLVFMFSDSAMPLPAVAANHDLVETVDTLNAGIHFRAGIDAADLAHKAVAVNLSDLAAMGADPLAVSVIIRHPPAWTAEIPRFSERLEALAGELGFTVLRLQTVVGPLSVTLQAWGQVPCGEALRRAGARPGDRIYVSGWPGEAGMALGLTEQRPAHVGDTDYAYLLGRLDRPQPRLALGRALRGLASACIDVSDGLAADLGHVLERSGTGAELALERLPVSTVLRRCARDEAQALSLALGAGDDYELCFTLPPAHEQALADRLHDIDVPCACIGTVTSSPGLRLLRADGTELHLSHAGYRHFTMQEDT